MFAQQGYQGMVDGGDNIVEATWQCVSGIIQMVCCVFKINSLLEVLYGFMFVLLLISATKLVCLYNFHALYSTKSW